jgi:hypothetical protein
MLTQAYQTDHAALRMAQRHLSFDEVQYVMLYGVQYRCAGVLHCYLRGKDIPESDRRYSQYSRLEGTAVLLDSESSSAVITVYRNRSKNALKAIRRKAKYDRYAPTPNLRID